MLQVDLGFCLCFVSFYGKGRNTDLEAMIGSKEAANPTCPSYYVRRGRTFFTFEPVGKLVFSGHSLVSTEEKVTGTFRGLEDTGFLQVPLWRAQ